jgi:S1-C subfamily serine protease
LRARELAVGILLAGCASAPRDEIRPEDLRLDPPGGERAVVTVAEAPARLTRAELEGSVRAGLGAFLANVVVSPALSNGRFVGWRLDRARYLHRWNRAGLDLREGDVVTRVNGGGLERPDDALAVFAALRTATELRVEVIRAGQPLTLRLAVAD